MQTRRRHGVSAALGALLLLAGGCTDGPGAPRLVAQLEIGVDSVVPLGQTAGLNVSALDAGGAPISGPAVRWSMRTAYPWVLFPPSSPTAPEEILALDSAAATVRALQPGRVWVIATSGSATDSVLLHSERPLVVPPRLDMEAMDTFVVSPGAKFSMGAADPAELYPLVAGRWYSSDSTVAAWSPISGNDATTQYRHVLLTARAPGTSTLKLAYGGQSVSFVLEVREPGPLQMDEVGRCGLDATGELWCSGTNVAGNLATFTATECRRSCWQQNANVPIRGARGMRFRTLTTDVSGSDAGTNHSCGIRLGDSRAYCWGFNHIAPYIHGVDVPPGRLAGSSDRKYCPEVRTMSGYEYMYCTFVPLAVDRELNRRLVFRTIKALNGVTCGTTGAPAEPEEIWCWGDTRLPTRRAAFPAGWPVPTTPTALSG